MGQQRKRGTSGKRGQRGAFVLHFLWTKVLDVAVQIPLPFERGQEESWWELVRGW